MINRLTLAAPAALIVAALLAGGGPAHVSAWDPPTPSPTVTQTPTVTATLTATATPTRTFTPTPTSTPSCGGVNPRPCLLEPPTPLPTKQPNNPPAAPPNVSGIFGGGSSSSSGGAPVISTRTVFDPSNPMLSGSFTTTSGGSIRPPSTGDGGLQ